MLRRIRGLAFTFLGPIFRHDALLHLFAFTGLFSPQIPVEEVEYDVDSDSLKRPRNRLTQCLHPAP